MYQGRQTMNEKISKSLKITLLPAPVEYKPVIENLARFYVYDLSRYSDNEPDWEFPEDGLYAADDVYFNFASFWCEPGSYPFIIRVQDELTGFVLVNKKGSMPDVDWYMSQFYVVARFQGKGVGREIARRIFDQFPGVWEVSQLPNNKPSIAFWRAVINEYTQGTYTEVRKTLPNPKPHEAIIQTFKNII